MSWWLLCELTFCVFTREGPINRRDNIENDKKYVKIGR